MARDYAKQRNPNAGRGNGRGGAASRRPPPHSGGSGGGMPGWVWLIVGLAIGLVVAAFAYIGRPAHQTSLGAAAKDDADVPRESARPAEAAKAKTARKEETPVPDKVPPRYTFYNDLPKIEVTIPREYTQPPPANDRKPAPVPPPEIKTAIEAPGAFVIQVGAYKSREEADRQRANLALIGYESRIEQVTISERETRFRVRLAPQPSLEAAKAVVARLQNNKIPSFVVKVKD